LREYNLKPQIPEYASVLNSHMHVSPQITRGVSKVAAVARAERKQTALLIMRPYAHPFPNAHLNLCSCSFTPTHFPNAHLNLCSCVFTRTHFPNLHLDLCSCVFTPTHFANHYLIPCS